MKLAKAIKTGIATAGLTALISGCTVVVRQGNNQNFGSYWHNTSQHNLGGSDNSYNGTVPGRFDCNTFSNLMNEMDNPCPTDRYRQN